MRNRLLFRKVIGITISSLLVLAPAQAAMASVAEIPVAQEKASVASDGTVCYYEAPSGASSAIVISNGETLAISFDSDLSGLSALLEQKGTDHIDSLIMAAFSDTTDEAALTALHESYPIGHLYASSGHAAITAAGRLGIKTDYLEYLSVGKENVILYPDAVGNLGVLIFDENSSLFAADTISDMSVLNGHQEIGYISVLSISDRTGTDEEIISLMDPQVCIITGNIPDEAALSSFYNTTIAKTQTFYINHYSTDGIEAEFPNLTEIQGAAFLHMPVPDPELFVIPEEETTAEDIEGTEGTEETEDTEGTGESDNTDDSNEGPVSAKQAIAEAALRIWRGEIGQGQTRTDTLRSEGFTDEEMQEIQRMVDKIASEKLGACTAVIFHAGDHADDPDAQIVSIGSTISELQLTSKDDYYQFTGWYTDQDCKEKFDFSEPIQNKTHLYAGWEQTGGQAESQIESQAEDQTKVQTEVQTNDQTESKTESQTEQEESVSQKKPSK